MASSSKKELIALFAVIAIAAIIGVTDGKPPSRISFGRVAPRGSFPYMVSIRTRPQKLHDCGGAIIGSRFILTAAHCVYGVNATDLVIRAGSVKTDDPRALEVNVSRVITHPRLRLGNPAQLNTDNDIAVLVLDQPLFLAGRVRSVSLPWHPIWLPTNGVLGGWGRVNDNPELWTSTLLYAYVRVLDDSECRERPSYDPTRYNRMWPIGRQFFCGVLQSGSTHGGDSGSPVVMDDYGRETIIGITSIGGGVDETDSYWTPPPVAHYVNVFHYVPWIKQVMFDN